MKRIAKGLAVLNIMASLAAAMVIWILGRTSLIEMLDIPSYVGLGMGALGALMFFGSTTGSSASTGIAASAADQPGRMMQALWGDRTSGVSTGALLVLGGLSFLGLAWLLAALFGAPT